MKKQNNPLLKNKIKGFTLIELLVVVLIIGILAAVALPKYQVAVAKARYARIMPMLTNFKHEQELFLMNNGRYATTWEELGAALPDGASLTDEDVFWLDRTGWSISNTRVWVTLAGEVNGLEYSVNFAAAPNPNKRYCIAYNDQPFAARVCKSLGGVPTSSSEGKRYTAYELP